MRLFWFVGPALVATGVFVGASTASQAPASDPHFKAVVEVCGRCHSELPFLGQTRTWPRWNDVFHAMSGLGATGSEAQLEQVTAFFLDHLTTVNVNTGSPEELAWVLDVSDEVASEIVRRRSAKLFQGAADLAKVPGVRAERLALLGERLQFSSAGADGRPATMGRLD
jgi:hypothetical protein